MTIEPAQLLRSVPVFRGPRKTLFVYNSARRELFICGWDGAEIYVPEADLRAYVDRLMDEIDDSKPSRPGG